MASILPGRSTGASRRTLSSDRRRARSAACAAASSASEPASRNDRMSRGNPGATSPRSAISPSNTTPIRVSPDAVNVASLMFPLLLLAIFTPRPQRQCKQSQPEHACADVEGGDSAIRWQVPCKKQIQNGDACQQQAVYEQCPSPYLSGF